MVSKFFKQVLEEVILYSNKFSLLEPNMRIGLGVSGGPDSTALVRVFQALKSRKNLHIVILHFDHRLQEISREHARFVAELAKQFDLPFELGRWSDAKIRTGNQKSARRARFRFFNQAAKKHDLSTIALGHNANDQAETVLWRLLRGSSPEALSGIRPKRKFSDLWWIRPLLGVSRGKIEAMLQELNQSFCQDPTNETPKYLRNRIRHDLLPLLQDRFNPQILEHLCNLGHSAQREGNFLDQEFCRWLEEQPGSAHFHSASNGTKLAWPKELFSLCPEGLRYRLYMHFFRMEKNLPLDEIKQSHLKAMEQLLQKPGGGWLALPRGWAVFVEKKRAGNHVSLETRSLHSP